MTFGEKVTAFYRQLEFRGQLPDGIQVMNPYREDPQVMSVIGQFCERFYDDCHSRTIILGINPGRYGAGATGIPFTDTKRLSSACGIKIDGKATHEPSSAFIYEMIETFGGVDAFYKKFYISAICPLGFTVTNRKGRVVNYNYYDSRALQKAVLGFIVDTLQRQLSFGIERSCCYCLGTGRNEAFLRQLNEKHGFFREVIALEHPRYIMQYKAKEKSRYIEKYIHALGAS